MNDDELASLWADGSVSINESDAPTSTEVVTSPIWRVNVKLMGAGVLTSSGSRRTENPEAVTTISYMLGGTLLNRNAPLSSVMVVCVELVTWLRSSTWALGITILSGSSTDPVTVPLLADCENSGAARNKANEYHGNDSGHTKPLSY